MSEVQMIYKSPIMTFTEYKNFIENLRPNYKHPFDKVEILQQKQDDQKDKKKRKYSRSSSRSVQKRHSSPSKKHKSRKRSYSKNNSKRRSRSRKHRSKSRRHSKDRKNKSHSRKEKSKRSHEKKKNKKRSKSQEKKKDKIKSDNFIIPSIQEEIQNKSDQQQMDKPLVYVSLPEVNQEQEQKNDIIKKLKLDMDFNFQQKEGDQLKEDDQLKILKEKLQRQKYEKKNEISDETLLDIKNKAIEFRKKKDIQL